MYFRNIPRLRKSDILLVTYPGSGTTWIANILCELGLPYVDGYTEELPYAPAETPFPLEAHDRLRTPALDRNRITRFQCLTSFRVIKTHLWPTYFDCYPVRKVILLMRDGRDSVLSYYHWRTAFSEEGECGPFSEFLRRPGFNGETPLIDWALTYLSWISTKWVKDLHVIKLEDGKRSPVDEVEKLLKFIGVERTRPEIQRAAEASTFEKMRSDEEQAMSEHQSLSQGYIMRKGTSGQWRADFSRADKIQIEGLPSRTLELFGYSL